MSLTYLDQNALIELGHKSRKAEFRAKLNVALESGSLTIVASITHLIETANTTNRQNAITLAESLESLKPAWLVLNPRRLEIAEDFYRFANIACSSSERVISGSHGFAHGVGQPSLNATPKQFVEELINHPELRNDFESVCRLSVEASRSVRKDRKAGKLSPDRIRRAQERTIRAEAPNQTPSGLQIAPQLKEEYAKQAKVSAIPTMAIESAISEYLRTRNDYTDRNSVIDKFCLFYAPPYVDEIVSNDKLFRIVYPEAEKSGHVRARLIRNEVFVARFES
jgi:hypothetical protein